MFRTIIGFGLYAIAGALCVIWSIEYFGFNSGDSVHTLLVIAIVLMLVKTSMHLPAATKVKDFEQ